MSQCTQVIPEIPCANRWALAGYRTSAMMAYLLLQKDQVIQLEYPVRYHAAQQYFEVRYLSAIPEEWALDALAAQEQKIIARLRHEQVNLQAQMQNMLGEYDMGVIPAMERMIDRHNEIYEILREYEERSVRQVN